MPVTQTKTISLGLVAERTDCQMMNLLTLGRSQFAIIEVTMKSIKRVDLQNFRFDARWKISLSSDLLC